MNWENLQMATGVTRRADLADVPSPSAYASHTEPLPLPDDSVMAEIQYSGRAAEAELLRPYERAFTCVSQRKALSNHSSIGPNAVVWGDNFYALNSMLSAYSGKVDLVYLDPPFCTGFDFHSRSLTHAYEDQMFPTAYLEFMRRRLILLRELLSRSGSIYIHIGHQMMFHLKVIMDEIFGAQNFRNLVVRRKCSSKNYTRKQYPNLHDYILFYSKSDAFKWNRPTRVPSPEWLTKEYPKQDQKGRYKLVPIHAPGVRNGSTGQTWRGMQPPPGKHWQFTPDKLDGLDRSGEMHWSKNGNPRRKVYLPEDKGIPLTDYWPDFRDAHHQSIPITGYPTEKNLNMLQMIVRASSDAGDLVLDPFCGSGTTLHAADDLDRKWIGIDASPAAIEATVRRLKDGLKPMGDYVERKESRPENLEMFDGVARLPRKGASFRLLCDTALADRDSEAIGRVTSLIE